MTTDSTISARVVAIVAEALAVDPARVELHSSLTDDLGAESIDFLDIVFRIEDAFALKIPDEELWKGSVDTSSEASIEAGVLALKARMPSFHWDRFPEHPTKTDLPRLITVQTIVDYLERRLRTPDVRG